MADPCRQGEGQTSIGREFLRNEKTKPAEQPRALSFSLPVFSIALGRLFLSNGAMPSGRNAKK